MYAYIISGNLYYLMMNKGPWGGRGCRFPKVRWCGRLECQFSAFWQCDPGESVLSRRVSVMCQVMPSSGVVVGVCGTWCATWDGFFVPCPCFYCVQTVWCSRGITFCIIRSAQGSCS